MFAIWSYMGQVTGSLPPGMLRKSVDRCLSKLWMIALQAPYAAGTVSR